MHTGIAAVGFILFSAGSWASAQAPLVAEPASAAASAPAPNRGGGAPRPYRAPIQVPSAAGQITSPALPAPPITVTPAPRPTFSTTCDNTGCWGSDGTRYNAIGGALVRPDGSMCQNVGGVMQCP